MLSPGTWSEGKALLAPALGLHLVEKALNEVPTLPSISFTSIVGNGASMRLLMRRVAYRTGGIGSRMKCDCNEINFRRHFADLPSPPSSGRSFAKRRLKEGGDADFCCWELILSPIYFADRPKIIIYRRQFSWSPGAPASG